MKFRLPIVKILGLAMLSILLGYVSQIILFSDSSPNALFDKLGFTLLVPVFVIAYLAFLHVTKISNKFVITCLCVILFILITIINLLLSPTYANNTSDMAGLIYIFAFPSAILIGLFFGIYIAFNLDKGISTFQKYAIYSLTIFIILFFVINAASSATCNFNNEYLCLSQKAVEKNDIGICNKASNQFKVDNCMRYTYANLNFPDKSCSKISDSQGRVRCLELIEFNNRVYSH